MPKALDSIKNAILEPDRVIESTAIQTKGSLGYIFLLGWAFPEEGKIEEPKIYVLDSVTQQTVKAIDLIGDKRFELCSGFNHRQDKDGNFLRIACVAHDIITNKQDIALFKLNIGTLEVVNYLTPVKNTTIKNNLSLSLLLFEDKISEMAVYEVNPYPQGEQNNILYFFIPGKGFKKSINITGTSQLKYFHSISRLRKSLHSSVVLSGIQADPQSSQLELAYLQCILDLDSETFPLSNCRNIKLPYFHYLARTKIINGNGADFYVYVSQKGLDTVIIGKCTLSSNYIVHCNENNFAYNEGILIKRLEMSPDNFIKFFCFYADNPNTLMVFGTFDDEKMEYDILSKECDSGFTFNGVHYSIEGNVIKGYKNPQYGLQIISNHLQIGQNRLQLQVTKGNVLYILNFRITLQKSLYSDVKIDASHYVIWEGDYDLLMPLNRNLIYGNGLSFKIQENIKGAQIFSNNLVEIKLKDQKTFDRQYFFGKHFIGVNDGEKSGDNQTVSIYICFRIGYNLVSECEFLTSSPNCLSSTRLFTYKPLGSNSVAFRFIDRLFERETHILYNADTNEMTSFNIEVYQDEKKTQLEKQQFEGADYQLGEWNIFMIRSFGLQKKVVIYQTQSKDKYNFSKIEIKDTITSFTNSASLQNEEISNFCPDSVSFSPSGNPGFQILSSCNDNIVLATYDFQTSNPKNGSNNSNDIINIIPIYFPMTSYQRKEMCKGQNVNAVWVQDTQVIYSVDPIDGSVIYYPLLGSSDRGTPGNVSYQMVNMSCVSNGNTIIGVVYKSDGSGDGQFLLLIYLTDPTNSRSRVLHSVIEMGKQCHMKPPEVVAYEVRDLVYITVHCDEEEGSFKYQGTYIVYLQGPLILIPKDSLSNINEVNMAIENWSGKTNFEFELDKFKDDKVKIWKQKSINQQSHILSLEGVFEGNLFNISMKKQSLNLKLKKRSQFEQSYELQTSGKEFKDLVFSDGYFVSMQYDGELTNIAIFSIEGVKLSISSIKANCNGLSTTHQGSYITVGTICTLNNKVKLHMLQTDLRTYEPGKLTQVTILNFQVDRYYDDLDLVSYKEDTQSIYFGVVLRKKQYFGAQMGIFIYNFVQQIGTFNILHIFSKSKIFFPILKVFKSFLIPFHSSPFFAVHQ